MLAREFFDEPKMMVDAVPKWTLQSIAEAAKFFKTHIVHTPITYRDTEDVVWHIVGSYFERKPGSKCNVGIQNGHCFYTLDVERLAKLFKCFKCEQKFNEKNNHNRHVKNGCSPGLKLITKGEKVEQDRVWSDRVLYSKDGTFSDVGFRWIEKQSRKIGRHIHHAMRGHGGERKVKLKYHPDQTTTVEYFKRVDGYDWQTYTVYEFYGCHFQGCECQGPERDVYKFNKTKMIEDTILRWGYNLLRCGSVSIERRSYA